MKRNQLHKAPITVKHISVTISQRNQDVTGKQTSNRTYWSLIKKVHPVANNLSHIVLKDAVIEPKENTQLKSRKTRKTGQKYSQMSLFPKTERNE